MSLIIMDYGLGEVYGGSYDNSDVRYNTKCNLTEHTNNQWKATLKT